MMGSVVGVAVAVTPPRRAFLRAGYTRIWELSVYTEFHRRGSRLQVERLGTVLCDATEGAATWHLNSQETEGFSMAKS
jgi:hypothetical protein